MSQLSRHVSWLLAGLCLVGCQTSGRMTRPPQLPQARNTPAPPDRSAQAQNPRPAPKEVRPGEFPAAPVAATKSQEKKEPELVVRATAPVPSDAPEAVPAVAVDPKPADEAAKFRELYQQAAAKEAGMRDYVARLRRREVVDGKQLPEDLLLFRRLKEPNSIYFKWLPGTQHEGRELIFVPGKYRNQLQVKTGRGDLLTGIRTEIDPKSERATANCRRTVEEACLGVSVRKFGELVGSATAATRDPGALQHLGPQQRAEFRTPMECILQRIPAGAEKHLPQGGTRYWYFCTDARVQECGLPTLIVTLDEQRREVEYYCFDRFQINVGLRPEDFDPNLVWASR